MPEIRFQDGATLRDISAIHYQDGATLRDVQKAYYQDGATLRLVWQRYANISITLQPDNATNDHFPPVRPSSEPISLSTSMTTANGTVSSIVYSIVNLTGSTGNISTSVSGNGTHSASITGTGTRGRFDGADYSVTFRVKATDGTSADYSDYITFSDNSF